MVVAVVAKDLTGAQVGVWGGGAGRCLGWVCWVERAHSLGRAFFGGRRGCCVWAVEGERGSANGAGSGR